VVDFISIGLHKYVNLLLIPVNYHLTSNAILYVSLDSVQGAVETFGVFILFVVILAFVTYYRNAFLNVFTTKSGKVIEKIPTKIKLQTLSKSVTQAITSKATAIKSKFNKFLK
tara:strand:+ start:14221 stop:14559 length:339 start_codon:yes stop_codon:yes gene_type:complete